MNLVSSGQDYIEKILCTTFFCVQATALHIVAKSAKDWKYSFLKLDYSKIDSEINFIINSEFDSEINFIINSEFDSEINLEINFEINYEIDLEINSEINIEINFEIDC